MQHLKKKERVFEDYITCLKSFHRILPVVLFLETDICISEIYVHRQKNIFKYLYSKWLTYILRLISCSQFKSVPLTGKTSSVKNTQKESESKHKSLPISSKPPDRSTSSSAISTQPKSTILQQKDKQRSERTKDGSVKYETDRSKISSNKVRLFTDFHRFAGWVPIQTFSYSITSNFN